jgi:hypothetical protein
VSPIPAGPYLPTGALVVVAWLGQCVDGLTSGMVATSLPRDLTTWAEAGFVQVTMMPSAAGVDSGDTRHAYAQIDAWGIATASDGSVTSKPSVGKATRLAELIIRGCEDDAQRDHFGKPVTLPADYLPARVLVAYPVTEPSPVPDDPSGYGRVTFDLALEWARL